MKSTYLERERERIVLVTIGKSRGERRVIFFLSGAIRKEAPVEALGAEESKIGGRGSYRNSRRARRSMQRERRDRSVKAHQQRHINMGDVCNDPG